MKSLTARAGDVFHGDKFPRWQCRGVQALDFDSVEDDLIACSSGNEDLAAGQ
jgi:hypothetical protein